MYAAFVQTPLYLRHFQTSEGTVSGYEMHICVYVKVIVHTHIQFFIILTLITLVFSSPGFHLSEPACINICFQL